MNTLEKYQADVEAAQKLLERAISSLEEATAINRNLFNKQTKKLPKKFVMDVHDAKYNCYTDNQECSFNMNCTCVNCNHSG